MGLGIGFLQRVHKEPRGIWGLDGILAASQDSVWLFGEPPSGTI